MARMTVYRDAAGAVHHIGEWDEESVEQFDHDPATGEEVPGTRRTVATRPRPAGWIEDEAEVEELPDGSRRVVA